MCTSHFTDEENDLIALGSDEELQQALLYGRPTGLLKLYIRLENSSFSTAPLNPGNISLSPMYS